jgi:hypothetical protein
MPIIVYVELSEKKEHILRCIQLGMDVYSSQIIAQCTEDEVEKLKDDEEFNNKILFYQKLQERDLLKQHGEAALIAGLKGSTHAFEWILEKLNPERFGKGGSVELPPGSNITIYLPEKNGN